MIGRKIVVCTNRYPDNPELRNPTKGYLLAITTPGRGGTHVLVEVAEDSSIRSFSLDYYDFKFVEWDDEL